MVSRGKVSIKLKKRDRETFFLKIKFYMYYCYETKVGDYKIGFATNEWYKMTRQDHLSGIKKSSKRDWDYEMIAYPHIINHKKKNICFITEIHMEKTVLD